MKVRDIFKEEDGQGKKYSKEQIMEMEIEIYSAFGPMDILSVYTTGPKKARMRTIDVEHRSK